MRALLSFLLGLTGLIAAHRFRRRRHPVRAMIVSPNESTSVARDGAVTSAQAAYLTLAPRDLDRLWHPANLENLGRTYWRFLSRVTLGLIRVIYGESERSVAFLVRPLTLLRFELPEYVLEGDHGKVMWRIRDGLLVARRGRGSGYLAIDVRREAPRAEGNGQASVRIEVEVSNFYPAIASEFSLPAYQATQSIIHVLVTQAFLRSLATLDLDRSQVGRLAALEAAAQREAQETSQP